MKEAKNTMRRRDQAQLKFYIDRELKEEYKAILEAEGKVMNIELERYIKKVVNKKKHLKNSN